MAYRKLYVLVEGDDDKRFFGKVIEPFIKKDYDSILKWEYSHQKKKSVVNFLKSIKSMKADYIYVSDIDNSPCTTSKKQNIKGFYKKVIDTNKIVAVIKEIESWYLAGLCDKDSTKLLKKVFKTTDDITKEQFNRLIPKSFDSRIDFMLEMLKRFSLETAKKKNRSFKYFISCF